MICANSIPPPRYSPPQTKVGRLKGRVPLTLFIVFPVGGATLRIANSSRRRNEP
jgi:hypothetical protein